MFFFLLCYLVIVGQFWTLSFRPSFILIFHPYCWHRFCSSLLQDSVPTAFAHIEEPRPHWWVKKQCLASTSIGIGAIRQHDFLLWTRDSGLGLHWSCPRLQNQFWDVICAPKFLANITTGARESLAPEAVRGISEVRCDIMHEHVYQYVSCQHSHWYDFLLAHLEAQDLR